MASWCTRRNRASPESFPNPLTVADGFGIDLIDLGIADRPSQEQRRFFSDDGYHASDEGDAAWATAMWAMIRDRFPHPTPRLPLLRPA